MRAHVSRARSLVSRIERAVPDLGWSDADQGHDLEVVSLRVEGWVSLPRARFELVYRLRNATSSRVESPRLVHPLPAGAEAAGLVWHRGASASGSSEGREVAEVVERRALEAGADGDSGRLELGARRLVAMLPGLEPGESAEARVAFTFTVVPTADDDEVQLSLPLSDIGKPVSAELELASGAHRVELPPGAPLSLNLPVPEQPILREPFDDANDAVFAAIETKVPPAPLPLRAIEGLFVFDSARGAPLESQLERALEALEGAEAPARFAALAVDVEAVWLVGPGYVDNRAAARARLRTALEGLAPAGASSFEALGRAIEAHPELGSPTVYWVGARQPSWGQGDLRSWMGRFPRLAAMPFIVPSGARELEALAAATGGRRVEAGGWGKPSSGVGGVTAELPGSAPVYAFSAATAVGSTTLVAGLVPRGLGGRMRLPDGSSLPLPSGPSGRGAARAYAELATRGLGGVSDGARRRLCRRFGIPCPGMVFAFGVPPAPASLHPPALSAPLGEALRRASRPRAEAGLRSRPWPSSPAREALERRYRDGRDGAELRLELVHARVAEGDSLGAVRLLSEEIERAPGDSERARLVAYGLLALGRHEAALQVLEGVLAARSFDPESWLEVALVRELAGRWEQAAEAYEVALVHAEPGASVHAAAAYRYRDLLRRTGGEASERRAALLPRVETLWMTLHAASRRLDLDLLVLEPDGHQCRPGTTLSPLGGRHPWDSVEGPELYLAPGTTGTYDALLAVGPRAEGPLAMPVGALLVVDEPGQSPRFVARWAFRPGMVASLTSARQ